MENQGGASVVLGTDKESPSPLPGYAIAILVIGIIVITVIVLTIILVRYRNYSHAKVVTQVKATAMQTELSDQRRALFSQS